MQAFQSLLTAPGVTRQVYYFRASHDHLPLNEARFRSFSTHVEKLTKQRTDL